MAEDQTRNLEDLVGELPPSLGHHMVRSLPQLTENYGYMKAQEMLNINHHLFIFLIRSFSLYSVRACKCTHTPCACL